MTISDKELIGYGRVSTLDQNPNLQIDALKAAGCDRIFIEKMSGTVSDRPELERAMALMGPGKVLVIWKLDRFGRSLRDLINLAERLKTLGAGLKVLTMDIDTTTAGGMLIFQIFGAFAEFELSLIKERSNAGRMAAKARGKVFGRKPKLSREDLETARTLQANGLSIPHIAERLRVGRSTLYKALADIIDHPHQ